MALLLSRLRSYNGFLPLYFNYWKISFTQNIEILCVFKDGFVNNTTLNNHVKAKHSDEKPYVCEHCPARYATSMSLSTHRSRVHRVNKAGNFWPLDQLPNYLRVWYFVSKIVLTYCKVQIHILRRAQIEKNLPLFYRFVPFSEYLNFTVCQNKISNSQIIW